MRILKKMMRLTLFFCVITPLFAQEIVKPEALPNIIYILADDMGYGDVSILNKRDQKIPTPHIDRLGKEGMIFTDAHSGSAVCTPTRYGIITGRYAWRTRLKGGVLHGYDHHLIETNRMTVASLLKKKGYKTAAFGKWHLGMDFPQLAGTTEKRKDQTQHIDWKGTIKNGPVDNGFDYFFGIAASLDMAPYIYIENNHFVGEANAIRPRSNHCRPGPVAPYFKMEEVLPDLTDKTVEYIKKQDGKKPFFIYMALTAPHTPVVPAKRFQGKNSLGPYGDFCEEVDWTVGEVLKALDEKGISENTLVIFTADNGCAHYIGVKELEEKGHYPSYIYRGYKADIFEGGHRVPFLVRWPKKVSASTTSKQLVCLTDLLATCAAIANEKIPENAAEDSMSFLPTLLEKGEAFSVRKTVIHHSIGGYFALRKENWKLEFCRGSGGWGDPKEKKAKEMGLPAIQLYDMDKDPAEKSNVYEKHPEVVKQLQQILTKHITTGRSTPGSAQPYVKKKNWKQLYWMKTP